MSDMLKSFISYDAGKSITAAADTKDANKIMPKNVYMEFNC